MTTITIEISSEEYSVRWTGGLPASEVRDYLQCIFEDITAHLNSPLEAESITEYGQIH